jgi:hypothetical protein
MKQKLLILFVFVLCVQQKTFSQAPPCKYQTNDGKTIITDSSGGWILRGYIQIVRSGNDYKLHMKYNGVLEQKTPGYKILKGQLFKLFLKNKDTVSLAANETKTADVLYFSHLYACHIVNDYSISAADVKRILASPCLGIEVNFSLNDGTARNVDLMHNLFHNLFINLLNCVMKG